MKVTITEFLITMGKICERNRGCYKCPINFVQEENRKGCALSFLYEKDIAEKVKDIVLKELKAGVKND